jgi:rhamnosyl/mannosyltransferase
LHRYQKKCTTIPLWIDEIKLKQTSETEQSSKNIKQTFGQPLLLSVGRLVSYKGYEFLIDALQSISAHALIIGTGPLKQTLLERIHRNNLDDRVMIIDPVEDLAPYYYAASVFVLPSITNAEAFGIVQLEAMFCGCPVINTSLPTGVPEVSLHNQTGLTVEPKNTQQLAQAINTLLNNETLRKQFAEQAHHRAVTHFSKKRSLQVLESVLLKTTL